MPNTMLHINDQTDPVHYDPPPGSAKGAIPRDYSKFPVGHYKSIPPLFGMAPMSDADIQAAIIRKNAEKSWLSDLRDIGMNGSPVPSRDQNGKGYSHTADTEVLTEKGFVAWPDWNGTDLLASVNSATGFMEFQAPTERHAYEYKDEMYYSSNRRLDFGVTRNHRMLVRKWDEKKRTLSDNYSFQRADQLGWYVGMMHAPSGFVGTDFVELSIEDDRSYDGDDFLALMALVASDGFVGGSPKNRNCVSFCCFRENRHDVVDALARRLGFTEQSNRRGVWDRTAPALAAWVRANCYVGGGLKAPNKRVPELVKCASMRQIKHFLEFFGDQNHSGQEGVFYSSSKRMIDDLQELHLRIGKRGTITKRGPRTAVYEKTGQVIESKESYTLVVGQVDRLCIDRKKHIETDKYKGLVYCATVPNGTLVTRRNGSVLISGNCWAHSGVSAHLLVRARDGQPYADLSAFAIACIIKGYRDEGGWGAEGVDWEAANGCPTSKTWPQQSMSRSNDTPAMRAEAAQHKVIGTWADMQPNDDRALATCLINDCPVVVDFDWWSHSVCACKLVSWQPLSIWIWNSWNDTWGNNGMGILSGSKASADGQVALITVRPSPA
jgi:hypothetical protein